MAYIEHYGIPRRSGRFPWGSGDRPYQGDTPKKMNMPKAPIKHRVKKIAEASLEQNIKQGKDKPNISPAEKVLKETNRITDTSKDIVRRRQSMAERKKPKEDLSKYSNEELQKKIQRMNLERQYESLKPSEVNAGYQKANDILDTFGDIVAITGGLVGIAVGINQLRK